VRIILVIIGDSDRSVVVDNSYHDINVVVSNRRLTLTNVLCSAYTTITITIKQKLKPQLINKYKGKGSV